MAMPIHFIDGSVMIIIKELKAGKSHEACLTNRTQPISHHIMPLVINALRGVHTDRQTHIPMHEPKQFQEARHAQLKTTGTWFNKNI